MIKVNSLYSLENISDCYSVTDDGQIVNTTTGKVKSQSTLKNGYRYVSLNEKVTNRQVKVTVHKIIALAFIRNEPYEVINHINGCKTDNLKENLEFCTQRNNVIHAWKSGLVVRKERVFTVRFTNGLTTSGTMKDLSQRLSIPRQTLYDLFYKQKCSAHHQITEILENEGQETIERVNPA